MHPTIIVRRERRSPRPVEASRPLREPALLRDVRIAREVRELFQEVRSVHGALDTAREARRG